MFLACDSRMSSRLSLKRIVFPVNNFCHSRLSCLTSIRHDLISHHCHFCNVSSYFYHLTVMNSQKIHAPQDGLIDWPCCKVRSQIMDPISSLSSVYNSDEDITTTLLFSKVDETQSVGRLTSPCPYRREKEVQSLHEFVTLSEKFMSSANRAETQEAYRRHIRQVKEYEMKSSRFEIIYIYEQTNQSKENKQAYQDCLKRNFIRDYFMNSKGNRSFLRHELKWICRSQRRQVQIMLPASRKNGGLSYKSGIYRIGRKKNSSRNSYSNS